VAGSKALRSISALGLSGSVLAGVPSVTDRPPPANPLGRTLVPSVTVLPWRSTLILNGPSYPPVDSIPSGVWDGQSSIQKLRIYYLLNASHPLRDGNAALAALTHTDRTPARARPGRIHSFLRRHTLPGYGELRLLRDQIQHWCGSFS